MFKSASLAGVAALVLAATAPLAARAGEPPSPPAATAFVHVNVAPMDRERVLKDQTVLVKDGRIEAVSAGLAAPEGYRVIDGHGTAWLSPGLADMHTHSDTRNDLAVYLANGVTTVLNMGGARDGFVDSTVPAANSGALPGPHVYASFRVDGTPEYNNFVIKTADQARAIADIARANRYDFIKVYTGLSPEAFDALAEAGPKAGLPLVGHGVAAVRLERQLAEGQVMVAHAEEFFYAFFTPPGVEETDTPPDPARIPAAVALARRHGAAVTADLATYAAIARQIGHPEAMQAVLHRSEIAYLSPNDRLAWKRSDYVAKTARLERKLEFLRRMVKAMADGGVELIAGTDAPGVPGLLPGYSLHEDLDELSRAGLTPYQALSTATRAPGEFIHRTKGGTPFGEVAAGYRADLVLTAGDPLQDLGTLRKPLGVMAAGRWRDAAALAGLLKQVKDDYDAVAALP